MNKTRHSPNRTIPFRYFLFLVLGFGLIFNSFSPNNSALAAFTFPLSETFMGATASGWVLGGAPASAILTSGGADPAGTGWLRLTNANTYQAGFAYYNTPIPTGRGLVITFDYASWGGTGADGLSFFLFDGTTTTFNVGASGGSLGYAQKTGVNGLSNGYLGLGLDEFGNYSNPNEGRSGGIGAFPEAVAIRGPGSGTTGYAYLAGTKTLTPTNPRLDCPKNNGSCGNGTARPPDTYYYRQVQITLIPVGSAYQVSVAMKFSKTAPSWTTLFGPFTMPTSAPSTLKMGFAASTGGSTNYHEIRNLNVSQQVPDLTATKAVQNATTGGGSVAPGNQLLYNVVLSNHTGADITGVHFTDSIPANTTFVANSATIPSGSTLNTTSPTLDVTGISVPANGQASLSFKVQVVNPIPIGITQISNQGTFTYGTTTSQTDGDAVSEGSQATTINVTAGPNFDTSTKTVTFQDKDGNGAVSPGDILTYLIALPNSGNQNSPTTLFSDLLPSNTTYVTASAAASSGTVSYNTTTKTLSWTVSVDAGSQATLNFNVKVNAGVLIRDVISNQGSVTFAATTVLTDADLASPGKQPTQLLVGGLATLTAVKTASVVSSPLLPNGELLYSIVLTNPSGFAIHGATFADSIPANTTYVASSLSSTSGTATFTAPSINVSGISVTANGGTVTISFKVKLDSLATGGVTQISNQGLVSWDSNQSGSNNTTLQTDVDASTVGQQPTLTNIPNADFSITKTVDNTNPAEADEITYTLRVVNHGPLDASSVLVADAVPSGLTYLSASATAGSYNNTNGQWSIGTLANGASATLDLHATVNVGQGGSEIPNTASVSSAYYDAVPANNSAGASLTVKTTSLSGVVTDSDSRVVLANVGVKITDAQGHICTTLTDLNGAYTFTSGQNGCLLSPGSATVETTAAPLGYLLKSTSKAITSGGTNTQDFALVRPSLSGVVTDLGPGVPIVGALVRLTQPASGADCTVTTEAGGAYQFISGTGSPVCTFIPGAATVVASASRYQSDTQNPTILSSGPTVVDLALGTVDLLINKSDGVTSAQPGENLNYVLTIINNGSITAENIVLTDAFSQTLPAYLTYVSDNSGVTPSHPSSSVYQWSLGSLAPGVTKSFILQAQVGNSFPDGDTRVSNYAKVTTTSPEKDFTNNEISDIDLVTAHPDLSIAKTFTSGIPAGTGSTISYRISGGNVGHATATNVTLVDLLDVIAAYTSSSANLTINASPASLGVVYDAGLKKLTFSLPDLAVGDTFIISYNAAIGSVTGSPVVNSAEITLSQNDPNLDNNNASVAVPTSQNVDVYVDKSAAANPGQAEPAGQIVYTLAYGNNGIDASTTTTLQDSIPANTSLILGSITGGGSLSGGVITWNLGPLASRASGSVSYAVTINTPLPAGVTAIDNSAAIASTPVDGYAANNTSSTSTPVTAQPDLVITKTDGMNEIMAGNTIPYTITYQNVGNQAATGVTIVDTLQSGLEIDPSKLSGVTYTGSNPASTYNAVAGTLTWTIGALGVNGAHTITIDLKVKSSVRPGSVVANHAALTDDLSNGTDINPGNNLVTHSDLVVGPLMILEKRGSGPVYDGQKVTYSIVWSNRGNSAAADVTIQDTLPGNTGAPTDITGGGIYNAGQGKLTWNLGSQPAGASGSVSYAIVPNVGAGGASQSAPSLTTESAGGSLVVTSTVSTPNRPWCENDQCANLKGIYQYTNGNPPTGWNDNPLLTVFDDSTWSPVSPATEEWFYWTSGSNLAADWVSMQTAAVNVGNYSFFRQAFCTPLNATGVSANLELASDDVSTIFLNGEYLGEKVGAGAAASFDGSDGIQAGINILAVQLRSNRHGGHKIFNGGDHSGLLYNLNAQFSGLRPFASAPGMVLAGQSVQFSVDEQALGGLPAYSYQIDYGDSTSAPYQPGKTFTHLYSTPGVYTATLTARDQYGCTASDQAPVTVRPVVDNLLVNPASVAYQDANGSAFSGLSGVGLELKPAADLAIVKTVQSGGVTPGQTVTYKLLVTNNGPDAVSGAVVSDTLPAALSGVTWTCAVTAGSCAHASGSGSALLETVNLPSGATATYLVQAAINPAAAGSLVNRASVTAPANSTDLTPSNNLSSVSTTLAPQAALVVSKTSDPLTGFAPGSSLTYLIQVSNPTGPSDAASVTITDLFPAEVNSITWSCSASTGSACSGSGTGDINDTAALKLGGAITYTARASINMGLADDTPITNTVSATFGAGLPVTATVQGLVITPAKLTATKEALNSGSAATHTEPFIDADSNGGISPGDTLKYKVVIATDTNDAYNVVYTDIPGSYTSLVVGSVVCDPACPTIDQGNTGGDTSVRVSIDEILANGSVSVYYQVLVKAGLPFQPGSITNQGLVASSNADPLTTDDPSTVDSGDATVLTLSTGSIGGVAWRDANDDGVKDISETLMGDVNVSLNYQGLDGQWGTNDDEFLYVLTDSNGAYQFDLLLAAPAYQYRIVFTLPTGYIFSPLQGDNKIDPVTGLSAILTLAPSEFKSNIHAGLVSQTVITLIKFIDHDADGVFDSDDILAPVSNPFELCAKGPLAPDYTCGFTDANSQVVFTDVPEGAYSFKETGEASWSQITPITPTFQSNVSADPFTLYIGNAHSDLECLGDVAISWPQPDQMKYTINFKKWYDDAAVNPSVAVYFEWTSGTGSLSYVSHSGTFTSTMTGTGDSGDPYVFKMNEIMTETTGSLNVIVQLDNPASSYAVLTTYASLSSTFEPTIAGSKNNICGTDTQYFGPTMLTTKSFTAYPGDEPLLLTWWKKFWESFGKLMVIR